MTNESASEAKPGRRRKVSAAEAFEAALSLHRRGRLREAEQFYRRIIAAQNGHSGALHHLALIASARGQFEEAARLLERALAADPQSAEICTHLGIALASLRRFDEAIVHYRRALAIAPKSVDALNNLGTAYLALGRFEEAIAAFDAALAVEPGIAAVHNNLGIALAGCGRHAAAAEHYETAIELSPEFAEAHNNLGLALVALNRHDDAIPRYERALTLKPDYAEACGNLGAALGALERFEQAISPLERMVAMRPGAWEGRINLGRALVAVKREGDAVVHLRAALALRPDHAETLMLLGTALAASESEAEAVAHFERAIALQPDLADAHSGLGRTQMTLGHIDQARRHFEEVLRLAPTRAAAHLGLATMKRFTRGDPQLATMEGLARDAAGLDDGQRGDLHFALGKAYADIGDHAAAFAHIIKGNALKRRQITYDEAPALSILSRTREAFSRELIEGKSRSGDPSELPVFIVGMPRSGTTLVEQILASHPRVFGGGERQDFSRALGVLLNPDGPPGSFLHIVQSLTSEQLRQIGASYVAALREIAPRAERVTDKMPANFRFPGLIHLALPKARIIHIRRDQLDTCISCFSRSFAPDSLPYSYDLAELGRYYKAYAELMQHWRTVLPAGAMLEVGYEELVADFEFHARRIVAYCGLEWDDACLKFHTTDRPIRTASAVQVRQPLYQSSVGRWRVYEPWLGPLRDALGSVH